MQPQINVTARRATKSWQVWDKWECKEMQDFWKIIGYDLELIKKFICQGNDETIPQFESKNTQWQEEGEEANSLVSNSKAKRNEAQSMQKSYHSPLGTLVHSFRPSVPSCFVSL